MSTALLSLTGLDFITSISGAATSISNVGPGLGTSTNLSGRATQQSLPRSAGAPVKIESGDFGRSFLRAPTSTHSDESDEVRA